MQALFATLVLFGFCAAEAGSISAHKAGTVPFETDVNIITGLDTSWSVTNGYVGMEIEGVAKAITTPAVQRAFASGRHRKVGFAVFTWSHGQFHNLAGWRVIATPADAVALAHDIAAWAEADTNSEAPTSLTWLLPSGGSSYDRRTDISEAIDHAFELGRSAPFRADRTVINIVGEGPDNFGESPSAARDRVVFQGGTVNAVVIGFRRSIVDYYRRNVIGGPGAFVVEAHDPAGFGEAMIRKFQLDAIAFNRD